MALALKVPVFFVVTKVDICPEHVLQHTLTSLQGILRKPGVRKKPFMVRTPAAACGQPAWEIAQAGKAASGQPEKTRRGCAQSRAKVGRQ